MEQKKQLNFSMPEVIRAEYERIATDRLVSIKHRWMIGAAAMLELLKLGDDGIAEAIGRIGSANTHGGFGKLVQEAKEQSPIKASRIKDGTASTETHLVSSGRRKTQRRTPDEKTSTRE